MDDNFVDYYTGRLYDRFSVGIQYSIFLTISNVGKEKSINMTGTVDIMNTLLN